MSDTLEIELPVEELGALYRLIHLGNPDERNEGSAVQLHGDGTKRRWICGNEFRGAVLEGEVDTRVYEIGVPPSLLRCAEALVDGAPHVTLAVVQQSDGRRLFLSGPGGMASAPEGVCSWPAETFLNDDIEWGGSATFRIDHVTGIIGIRPPILQRDGEPKLNETDFGLSIAEGELRLRTFWTDHAPLITRITAHDVEGGAVSVRVSLDYLRELLWAFEPEDAVTLKIPAYNRDHLLFRSDRVRAILMPRRVAGAIRRMKVEEIIEEVAGPAALVRDHDGDYPLHNIDASVYGHINDDATPPVLQVFTVLLDSIESSPELLDEINDLNARMQFARLFHVEGQVLAEADLIAETLDAEQLRSAIGRLLDIDREITPLLATVFGGDAGIDPVEARWASGRKVVASAQVLPFHAVDLTGPDAVEEWPLPETVWVISGWNPQGITYPTDRNEWINQRIASDVIGKGGRFVDGVNRHIDGTESTETLVVWGIDRAFATELGSRANQDAVYEITADTVSLVSCRSDRVESWPRG